MTLEETAAELRSFADANPYKPKNSLTVNDDRYKRQVVIDGHCIGVSLALLEFGPRSLYQLDIDLKDSTGNPVSSHVAHAIKEALLPTATNLGERQEKRRFILAAN